MPGALFNSVHASLNGLSRTALRAIAVAGVAIVGIADFLTGYDISISLFYFGPVALATWYVGWGDGVAVTMLAGLVWVTSDFMITNSFRHPAVSLWNGVVVMAFLFINAFLMNALRSRLSSEYLLARTDVLTSVLNPRAFQERLEDTIAMARRRAAPFVLVYIDVDNLKTINDNRGHSEGDRVLRDLAFCMKEIVRQTDVVARLGGDEFALLLPETDREGAQVLVEKLRVRMSSSSEGEQGGVTCSIGAVTFRELPQRAVDAVRVTDRLMYVVKRRGKNAVAWAEFDRATGTAVPVHEPFVSAAKPVSD